MRALLYCVEIVCSSSRCVALRFLPEGLSEVISLLSSFSFSPEDITYLRTLLPQCEEAFFTWLGELDCRNVRLYALAEGTLCFPRIPLIRVEVNGNISGGIVEESTRLWEVNSTACDVKELELELEVQYK